MMVTFTWNEYYKEQLGKQFLSDIVIVNCVVNCEQTTTVFLTKQMIEQNLLFTLLAIVTGWIVHTV